MPESVTGALNGPSERQGQPGSAHEVVGDDARDHEDKVARIEPEEFLPGVFRPPTFAHNSDETAAKQRFIDYVNDISRTRNQEEKTRGKAI